MLPKKHAAWFDGSGLNTSSEHQELRLARRPRLLPSWKHEVAAALAGKRAWPKDAPAQAKALSDLLAETYAPMSLDQVAAHFTARGRWGERLEPMLAMLVVLRKALREDDGKAILYRA